MAIKIERGASQRILDGGDSFAVQLTGTHDLRAALSALRLARVDLLGHLEGRVGRDATSRLDSAERATVSAVVNAPGGPLLVVRKGGADEEQLADVPQVVARRLTATGLDDGLVTVPPLGGPMAALERTRNAVVLRLFPEARVATGVPAGWLDLAAEWVAGDVDEKVPLAVRILGVEYEVPAGKVAGLLQECGVSHAWCDAVTGSLEDRIRTVSLTYGNLPHLALGAGGPHVDQHGMLARYRLLKEIAGEFAGELAYACIDFEPTFEGIGHGLANDGWPTAGGATPNAVARELLEDRVPDAYPFQILAPAAQARLGASMLQFEALDGGRGGLELSEPAAWTWRSGERDEARESGWDALAAVLVMAEDFSEARTAPVARTGEALESMGDADTPELAGVQLEANPHARRGSRLTLLELAAWLHKQPHSDHPQSVPPNLATYARWLNAGLPSSERQQLKPLAVRLPGSSADPQVERARVWMAAEWLVKVQAATWLRAAGLREAAQRLTALGPLTGDQELVRAVDLLGIAIIIASRRIEVTSTTTGGTAEDDQAVWEAWERTTERTGWVAASETATAGTPAELTYSTDLRVIECARDPRARAELEARRQSIGDTAWTTALRALAADTWERGWRTADQAARDLTGFTLRIEMGRAAKHMFAIEEELSETSLDAAEGAGRAALAKAALRGGVTDSGLDPWDDACGAAATSSGGREWRLMCEEARRAVGPANWEQAMADARTTVQALLADAPDAVARVVVASVAREACSAAARVLAHRAAAAARTAGSQADVARAVEDALGPTADILVPAAIGLLERMISPLS